MYTKLKNKRKEFVKTIEDAEVLVGLDDLQKEVTSLSICVGDKRLGIDSIDYDQSLIVSELLQYTVVNLKSKVCKIDAVLKMVEQED